MHSDTLRAGEQAADLPPPGDAALRFIGTIRTPWTEPGTCPRQGAGDPSPCRIIVNPPWVPALDGIAAHDEIEVLYWLHLSRRDMIRQSPTDDGVTTGTFALRSPLRPNPIGTSIVQLHRVAGGVLHVTGLDCLDGTPLIDLKPDRCAFTPLAPPRTSQPRPA